MEEQNIFSGTPLGVKVKNGDIETALKKFKNVVKNSKILFLYKEKQQFEKPSAEKRRKRFKPSKKNSENY